MSACQSLQVSFPQSHGAENPFDARNGQVSNHNVMHASQKSTYCVEENVEDFSLSRAMIITAWKLHEISFSLNN